MAVGMGWYLVSNLQLKNKFLSIFTLEKVLEEQL